MYEFRGFKFFEFVGLFFSFTFYWFRIYIYSAHCIKSTIVNFFFTTTIHTTGTGTFLILVVKFRFLFFFSCGSSPILYIIPSDESHDRSRGLVFIQYTRYGLLSLLSRQNVIFVLTFNFFFLWNTYRNNVISFSSSRPARLHFTANHSFPRKTTNRVLTRVHGTFRVYTRNKKNRTVSKISVLKPVKTDVVGRISRFRRRQSET